MAQCGVRAQGFRKCVFSGGCHNDGIRTQELEEMALNTVLEPEQGEEDMHMMGAGINSFQTNLGT